MTIFVDYTVCAGQVSNVRVYGTGRIVEETQEPQPDGSVLLRVEMVRTERQSTRSALTRQERA